MADSDVWRNGSVSAQPEPSAAATADDGSSPAVVVRLQPWHRRFATQFAALFWKNLLVNWRNLRATVLRILAPLFFMLLLWLTDVAISADNPKQPYAIANTSPAIDLVAAIPACDTNVNVRPGQCWDMFYTPNTSAAAQGVIQFMQANNPGRPISDDRVLGFTSPDAVNAWLMDNPERVLGGVHFSFNEAAPSQVDYLLQVNTSVSYFKDKFQDPTFFMQVPLQVLAERGIASFLANSTVAGGEAAPAQFDWSVATSMFAHPTTNSINVLGKSIGGFVFAANLFSFVLILSSVVAERERGLRQALKTMGMLESAFWLSWMSVEVLASVVFTLLLIGFGAMFGFAFFTVNSFAIVFTLFFVFQIAMVSVAFLLSTLLSKGSTAIVVGFVVFLVGWIVQSVVVFGFPYTPDRIKSASVITVILTMMPWAPLAKAGVDLGAASEDSSSVGISWSNRADYCLNMDNDPAAQAAAYKPNVYQDFDCVFNINQILIVLTVEYFFYFLLAIWLDHVLPDENGVRKGKCCYFLTRSYWCSSGAGCCGGGAANRGVRTLRPPLARAAELDLGMERDSDVVAEERRMQELAQHRTGKSWWRTSGALSMQADSSHAVEVFGLQKVFPGTGCCKGGSCCCCFGSCKGSCSACKSCKCCCSRAGRPRRKRKGGEFWAVKGSWFAIEPNRVFCLLGPNGAGKTTTINCLTGTLPPSGGDALVYGESLSAPGGMDRVRSLMGVCPQFDVLWGELTGQEHLHLYGRVKGLPMREVRRQAAELLEAVKLGPAANLRTSAYSGGMRRRLSVAIALLGDPLVVYLDEPTTGMDPISRRHVWDVIESSKAGRVIVLTTHSMEEADILGDQVAIMARGRVRAIGSALRLKQRFGSGYQLSVSVMPPRATPAAGAEAAAVAANAAAVKALFKSELGVEPADESRAYITFLVPKAGEHALPAFLHTLDARRQQLGVTDVQIGLTSLEEVFLRIARMAEVEAAAGDTTTVELDDGGSLEVALGEEWATHFTTGQSYFLRWVQDDNGSLQVLRAEPMERPEAAAGGGAGVAAADQPPGAVEMTRQEE
ncbi:ABC transporter A family member 2 [Chlorella vulgaris]